jgi:hypothetical protein
MSLPGFELLFSSVQSQLRSPQDAIVSAIHWSIVSAGFKLTGVGENPSVSVFPDDSGETLKTQFLLSVHCIACFLHCFMLQGGTQCTESLLSGWNASEIYVFHYVKAGSDPPQKFILKILVADSTLMLHFQVCG